MRSLRLRKETLAELTSGELLSVVGASGASCNIACDTAGAAKSCVAPPTLPQQCLTGTTAGSFVTC
ncbi:MAG TPA: hypothetical protein VFQ85_13665 [Mycobacteriales bacterium]|jgi:hypothetical protein|nr:hypothetical protein [Mycobacteriales bacterium]